MSLANVAPPRSFFVVGGTLAQDAPSYVQREADEEVFRLLRAGEYCHVLTPRQMGKSSLMVRTAARMRATGTVAILLDLTALGVNVSPEQWYRGQVRRIGRQLGHESVFERRWQTATEQGLGAYQRWEAVLTEFILSQGDDPVVLFIDEIDIVRSLPFSADEYFAGIRQMYNARAENPAFRRLTFCLLGVVTPFELIQDPRHTPFNVGKQIELRDFTGAEVERSLAPGLITPERDGGRVARLLQRVLYWTGGQPYLTQRLCERLATESALTEAAGVDRACRDIFFQQGDRASADDHLLFVRERLLRGGADLASVLTEYQKMLRRSASFWRRGRGVDVVREDDPTTAALRLSGIARLGPSRTLLPRNRIYSTVFDAKWAASQMTDAEARRLKRAYRLGIARTLLVSGSITAVIAVLAGFALFANARAQKAETEARRQLFVSDMNLAQRALEERNLARALALLERHRHTPEEASRFEWRYLWNQCHQSVVPLPKREGGVSAVRFRADAPELVTVSGRDAKIHVYRMPEGDVLRQIDGMDISRFSAVHKVRATLSPDGTRVGRYVGDRCEVVDVLSGAVTERITSSEGIVTTLAFSPDNRRLALGHADGVVTVRDISRATVVRKLPDETQSSAVLFSPDGRFLASGDSSGNLNYRDAVTGALLWHSHTGRGGFRAMSFSPDGRRLLTGIPKGKLSLLDAATGRLLRTVEPGQTRLLATTVSRQGMYVTSGIDQTVRVWDETTGRELRTFLVEEPADALALSADGRWLAAGDPSGNTSVWKVADDTTKRAPGEVGDRFKSMSLSPPDGTDCFAIDEKNRLTRWNVASSRVQFKMSLKETVKTDLVFSSNGERGAFSDENHAFVHDATTGQRIRSIAAPSHIFFSAVALSPDGKWLATGTADGVIQVWDVNTGTVVSRAVTRNNIDVIAFSPTGKMLLAGEGNPSTLHVIQLYTGHIRSIRTAHNDLMSLIVFSPDGGQTATVSGDSRVQLWAIKDGLPAKPQILSGHTADLYAVLFSPDGKTLFTAGREGIIHVWDTATTQEILSLSAKADPAYIYSLQFDRTGSTLLSADTTGTVRYWNGTAKPF